MPGASVGDVWRIYTKPSLKGRIIFRKRTSNITSPRVKDRNLKFAQAKPASSCKGMKWPAFVACLRAHSPR